MSCEGSGRGEHVHACCTLLQAHLTMVLRVARAAGAADRAASRGGSRSRSTRLWRSCCCMHLRVRVSEETARAGDSIT